MVGLYSDMSLNDLTTLKNWLLTKIEEVGAEARVNVNARVKQFKDQLAQVEAEIAAKQKAG